MGRTVGSQGEKTQAAIREAALDLIAHHGYEAVSMRRLAEKVGVQPAALYRYFPTKEDLLFVLMRHHMDGLLASWRAAAPAAGPLEARLAAFVDNHIRYHVGRRRSTHVSNLELRSLSPARLTEILRLRTAYEKQLRGILREGADDGVFDIDDVPLTAMAIIQMITGVIVWFRPGDRLSAEEVSHTYLKMTLRLVGAANNNPEETRVSADAKLRAG